jgi:serine/threonine protein kinase
MSPEQIVGQPLDIRSDIFSFGIVLYELFTGVKPFTDDEDRAVTAKIVKDSFPAPRSVNRAIPCALQRIIKKCLKKKPQRRYGSMLDVERRLGRRLAGRTTKPASLKRIADYLVSRNVFEAAPEQETMIITGKPSRLSRRASTFLAGAVVLLLAAAGGIYYYRSTGGFPEPALQPQRQAPLVTLPRATAPLAAAPTPTLLSAPAATAAAEQKKGPAPGKKPVSGTKKKKKQQTTIR